LIVLFFDFSNILRWAILQPDIEKDEFQSL